VPEPPPPSLPTPPTLPLSGVLVVDKPAGITSHDVVAVARRALGERGIGHTGTLDPMATGVLPLAVGKATRLVRFLSASTKDYDAVIRFGRATDTYDVTGTTTAESPQRPTRTALEIGLLALSGTYDQPPPPYSAKKVDGRRAYAMARRDEPVELKPVAVTVSRAVLTSFDDETASVSLTSSAGFYVRSFAHELGRRLGCGACLDALRRTRSGEFTVTQAVGLDELAAGGRVDWSSRVIQGADLLTEYPAVTLNDRGLAYVANGRDLGPAQLASRPGSSTSPGLSWVRVLDPEGTLVAMATPDTSSGLLHPSIVLLT
jgi:tRNA pseudouridine55 synthase